MPLARNITDRTLASPQGEVAYRITEKLTDVGYDTWWVGGCVRDMLLGKIPVDIDIGTAAFPDVVQSLFPKIDPKGKEFGSVHVLLGRRRFEVTTFREDDEASDGRRPETVAFGTREADALRRDFTVNALYFHPISRALYDPFGGEGDLKERLIRFIGDPAIRIKHDALRLLRAVRFRALLGGVPRDDGVVVRGQYHPETYAALREQAHMIEVLSGTRIFEELTKILLGPRPAMAFEDLRELGILSSIFPELTACRGIPQPADYHHEGDVWEHILACARSFREENAIDVRLAALFHDCGKVQTFSLKERIRFDHHASVSADLAAAALRRLQCPRLRTEKVAWLIRHHMMMGSFVSMPEERQGHWYHHPWFPELLQVMWLDIAGTDPADFSLYKKIVQLRDAFLDRHPRPEKPLLSGEEVIGILGIQPGERVGEVLKALHEAQVRGEVKTKKEARDLLKRFPEFPLPGGEDTGEG
ncbi:CCA tRNA nucleotidyltransferase [Candidatus Peregrinibacteria bacterium]|nr:CCA tRNA nucleotidyltransferase [Candidatus Peregrinibacteria bacterium]MBI4129613.1 CCA tRNA nucleotidyltransferase [Candidatus Peregrinibacteria bacterium]